MRAKKEENTFYIIGITRFANMKKKVTKNSLGSFVFVLLTYQYLLPSSSSQYLLQHSSKAEDRAGFLQCIQESADLAVTNGEQLCPRDTLLPPMHIFQMGSILKDGKRKKNKKSLVLSIYCYTGKHHK